MRGAARLTSIISAVKRRIYGRRGEPYRIRGHKLRYVVGTKPVSASQINSKIHVLRYDALQLSLFADLLHEGDRAIDIGAHNGGHALIMAALCGTTGEVTVFEPNPSARQVLLRNVRLNPEIKAPVIESAAVDHQTSDGVLHVRPRVIADINASLVSTPGTEPIAVTTVSIDDYLASHPGAPVRLVKIDAEGAEIRILQGAQRVLQSETEILCEIHPYAWPGFGSSLDELKALVKASGRRIRYIHEEHEIGDKLLYGIVILERTPRATV